MLVQHRKLLAAAAVLIAVACNSPTGCSGFQSFPPGSFSGTKIDSAGALRISQHGYGTVNANSASLLALIAPGGRIETPVACSIASASIIGDFAISDQGSAGCTDESCGRGDGKCDARDVPQVVALGVNGLTLGAKSPDLVEAKLNVTVQTGQIVLSSVKRNSPACALSGGGPVKCTIDVDSARSDPAVNTLNVEIKLALRNGLVAIELSEIGGSKACGTSGAGAPPECIDPSDITVKRMAGGCDVCGILNNNTVKQLLIDQLTKSLEKQLTSALDSLTCQPCGDGMNLCPASAACSSSTDAGRCLEIIGGACSPRFLGVEGRADLGAWLGAFGVSSSAALDLTMALGGSVASGAGGTSLGMRGGFKEVAIASCVTAVTAAPLPALPLPNFELDAPGPYDLAFSVSGQMLSEALLHAQQSGALCLEVGHESVAQLESATLETFLPSLKVFTHGQSTPLRVVIRPLNPPAAVIGKGTVDSMGKLLEPLLKLSWPGLEMDMYARIEDRFVRLFTIAADVELPMSVQIESCGTVKPVIGDLMNAVKRVEVKNSKMLAEDVSVIASLVPTLLTLAEPALVKGLPVIALPAIDTGTPLQVKLEQARGVGQVAGTGQYNHLGVYASLVGPDAGCPSRFSPLRRSLKSLSRGAVLERDATRVSLAVPEGSYSVRVDEGFWSMPLTTSGGALEINHPRLLLKGPHRIELQTEAEVLNVELR